MELKNVEKLEKSKVKLTIHVGGEEFRKAVDASYRKNASKINVPGFRKGKAPRKMLEKLYGEEIFYEDAVNFAYPSAYQAAVEEAKIDPIAQADIDIQDLSSEGFIVVAEVAVKPEMSLKGYKELTAVYTEKRVTEAQINEEINKMAERMARIETVDRAAKDGDTVTLDFEGFIDGTAFAGGKGEGFSLTLGSKQFIPGFEEKLIGVKAGEDKDVEVNFPEEYHVEELKGKPAVFKCTVHEVKETITPEIDDEFAKDTSEFESLQELRDDTKGKIKEAQKEEATRAYEEAILDVLVGNLEGEIPDEMIKGQVDQLVQDFSYRMAMQGMDMETYLKTSGTDISQIRMMFGEQANRQVKVRLALEEVAKAENIEVTEKQIEEEYAKMAESYKMELEKVKEAVPQEALKEDLATQQALAIVMETAKKEKASAAKTETEEKPAAKKSTAKKPAAKEKKDA